MQKNKHNKHNQGHLHAGVKATKVTQRKAKKSKHLVSFGLRQPAVCMYAIKKNHRVPHNQQHNSKQQQPMLLTALVYCCQAQHAASPSN
jgi:hypothetical protein